MSEAVGDTKDTLNETTKPPKNKQTKKTFTLQSMNHWTMRWTVMDRVKFNGYTCRIITNVTLKIIVGISRPRIGGRMDILDEKSKYMCALEISTRLVKTKDVAAS